MRRHRGRHRAPRRPPPVLARLARPALTVAVVAAAVLALGVALRQPPEELRALPPLPGAVPPPRATFTYPPPRPPVVPITSRASEPEEVVTAEKSASPPAAEPPPAAPPPPKPPPPPPAASCSTKLAGTRPHVAQVGNHIAQKFGVPLSAIGGYRTSARDKAGHPAGLALDWMVGRAKGDAIADYLLTNRDRFAVRYVIWRQRYNDGSGWRAMGDRGSATANHMDHVHASFKPSAPVGVSC
jgi:hypothetical protein